MTVNDTGFPVGVGDRQLRIESCLRETLPGNSVRTHPFVILVQMALDGMENPLLADSPGAWDALIESIGPASLLVIINLRLGERLRRQVTPEDVLQESLLQAWRDRESFEWRGMKSFRAWLLTLIDHRIRDFARHYESVSRAPTKPATRISLSPSSESSLPAEIMGSTTPSRLTSHRERAAQMRIALDALPEELRNVVYLRIFEQLTFVNIAATLEIGEEAARSRFRKGSELYRRRLQTLVSSHWTNSKDSGTDRGGDYASNRKDT